MHNFCELNLIHSKDRSNILCIYYLIMVKDLYKNASEVTGWTEW